jgi:hypothetical protein
MREKLHERQNRHVDCQRSAVHADADGPVLVRPVGRSESRDQKIKKAIIKEVLF